MHYASIRKLDTSNGDGVGVSLFVQGCPIHCKGCFNTITWDFNGGKEWTEDVEDKFMELIRRPYIKRVSILGGEPLASQNLDGILHLVQRIKKEFNTQQHIVSGNETDHNMLNETDDEIRLSFGDTKTIWLYTGYCWEDIFKPQVKCDIFTGSEKELVEDAEMCLRRQIISLCDVLVDGRYEEDKRDISLPFRGSSNQRIIDVQKSLDQDKIILHCD